MCDVDIPVRLPRERVKTLVQCSKVQVLCGIGDRNFEVILQTVIVKVWCDHDSTTAATSTNTGSYGADRSTSCTQLHRIRTGAAERYTGRQWWRSYRSADGCHS